MRVRRGWAVMLASLSAACTEHMQLLGPGLEGGVPRTGEDGEASSSTSDGATPDPTAGPSGAAMCPALPIALPNLEPNPVGEGTAGSCTPQAVAEKVARGGLITFRCGDGPVAIALPAELTVSTSTVIDGGELAPGAPQRVTLQAAMGVRAFTVRNGSDSSQTVLGLKNVVVTGGRANSGASVEDRAGGAILNDGAVVILQGAALRQNRSASGGAIAARGAAAAVLLAESTLEDNNSSAHGGAIALDGGQLWIAHSIIRGNTASMGNGGGIYIAAQRANVSICGSTVSSNMAGQFGGGLYLSTTASGEANIVQSTFAANVVGDAVTGRGQGGALYTQGAAVTLRQSTISGNQAGWVAGAWVGAFRDNTNAVSGTITMENVTIADNHNYENATMGYGCGLWLAAPVQGTIKNCTIANNEGSFATGIATGGTVPAEVVVSNSIIANDAQMIPLNCTQAFATGGAPNLQWPVETSSSAAMAVRCGGEATLFHYPGLGPLSANEAPTQTMPLLANSPAIGLGVACPAVDQRGVPRPATGCALGAYEPR